MSEARQATPARPARKRPAPQVSDAHAFLISQVGSKGSPERKRADEVHEFIVVPAATAFELKVVRSDLDPTPGQLTTQIIKGIIEARVVVADLTGRNPNVFFELGVAQSFAKPLVLLVKDAAALPFDVKSERTIEVGDGDVLGVTEARDAAKKLEASLRIVLDAGYQPANLVTEVASARSLDALAPENPIASELASLRETLDEVHALVRRPTRTNDTRGDLGVLLRFIERLVEDDRLFPAEVRTLPTDLTTAG